MISPKIASVAVAVPPFMAGQETAKEYFVKNYASALSPRNLGILKKVLSHPSQKRRFFAIENSDILLNEDQDERIARFTHWAVELSSRAVSDALSQADLTVGDVSALVVNTCTSYICPGISTYLIEKLGLRRGIPYYDLVGAGCGGAIPNLQVCEGLLKQDENRVVVSVSVEICTATFQMGDDPSLIISNALFADGAAAAVLWNRPKGLELVASANNLAPEHRDAIRYIYKGGRLYNQLSAELPKLIKKEVAQTAGKMIKEKGLEAGDIKHWAVHAAGEKITNAVRDGLGLSEAQLGPTRHVLSEYGNMSSPTVWFVLKEILEKGIEPGEYCVMLGFGAGLSVNVFLFRRTDA